jgi:uncharacterized protein
MNGFFIQRGSQVLWEGVNYLPNTKRSQTPVDSPKLSVFSMFPWRKGSWRSIVACVFMAVACPLFFEAAFAAPSFDCTKNLTPTEKLICADRTIGDLDGQLAAVFGRKRSELALAASKSMVEMQRKWLNARADACQIPSVWHESASKEDTLKCLSRLYREQITYLNSLGQAVVTTEENNLSPTDMTETHLNIYDLADACKFFNLMRGAYNIYGAISQDKKMDPIFISRRYYASLDENKRFKECELSIYAYTFNKEGRLNGNVVSADSSEKIRKNIDNYPSPPPETVHYNDYISNVDEEMSGCPLEINWISIGQRRFAILSIANKEAFKAISAYVYSSGNLFDCNVWRSLNLSRYYIFSGQTEHILQYDDKRDVIVSSALPVSVFISSNDDFKCFRSHDIFDFHIVVEKKFFDSNMRTPLMSFIDAAHLDRIPAGDGFKYLTKSLETIAAQNEWLRHFAEMKDCSK